MELPPDWLEFLSLLKRHDVKFVVVGAYALAAAGWPRASQDIDIFIEPTSENALRVSAALREFGFEALADAAVTEFAKPPRMATLGVPPMRIDIMNDITGVTFEEAYCGAIAVAAGNMECPFLGIRELVANKRATGRTKDLLDIELLKEAGLWSDEGD